MTTEDDNLIPAVPPAVYALDDKPLVDWTVRHAFDEEMIRLTAYYIWEYRVGAGFHGTAEGDWFQAIEELRAR